MIGHRPRKTVEDYLALPDDVRAELIDGELYVTPAPGWDHQDVVGQLYRLLTDWAQPRSAGRVGLSPIDVHLPSGDVVQPDVLFVSASRLEICTQTVQGAPDLAVEVVSPSRPERDRFVKRMLYETNGVREYWIVDPEERTIEVLRLADGAFAPAGYFLDGQVLVSHALPGLELPVADVFPRTTS